MHGGKTSIGNFISETSSFLHKSFEALRYQTRNHVWLDKKEIRKEKQGKKKLEKNSKIAITFCPFYVQSSLKFSHFPFAEKTISKAVGYNKKRRFNIKLVFNVNIIKWFRKAFSVSFLRQGFYWKCFVNGGVVDFKESEIQCFESAVTDF